MKTLTILLILIFLPALAFAGDPPPPMQGHTFTGGYGQVPDPLEGHSMPKFGNASSLQPTPGPGFENKTALDVPGFGNGTSVSEAEMEQAVEQMEDAFPDGYFTRSMKTLQGTLVRINTESMTATVRDGSAELEFTYDRYTMFMVNFKPAGPEALSEGARVVGLFDDSDGELYLGRLIEITKYQKRRRRR